jgi:hypothetical protein
LTIGKGYVVLYSQVSQERVIVKNKIGKQRYIPLSEVTARVIEEEFQVVKAHLEGSDHSAHFPNKTTGLYDKLKASVVYVVYGHPYNKWAVWNPSAQERRLSTRSLDSSKESLLLPNEVPEKLGPQAVLAKMPSLDREQIENYRASWLKVMKKQTT